MFFSTLYYDSNLENSIICHSIPNWQAFQIAWYVFRKHPVSLMMLSWYRVCLYLNHWTMNSTKMASLGTHLLDGMLNECRQEYEISMCHGHHLMLDADDYSMMRWWNATTILNYTQNVTMYCLCFHSSHSYILI